MQSNAQRITTPFGSESTAAEVVEGIDLGGKRMIVTGGASGIGIETARALVGAGAEVTLAVRNVEAGEKIAAEIQESTGEDAVHVGHLDLADQASVKEFAAQWEGPLDVLVNNAGVMAIQELTHTPKGYEMQFATNHLGHFGLAMGLHEALAAADKARIVSVSSSGHLNSPVVFEDINFEDREYSPWGAYGQSKTANVLFSLGVTKRWEQNGITSNALMPGGIATNLQRHLPSDYIEKAMAERGPDFKLKTPEQGAATSVLLATSPDLADVSGHYFEDCNEGLPKEEMEEGAMGGVADYALDPEAADRLWEESLRMIDG